MNRTRSVSPRGPLTLALVVAAAALVWAGSQISAQTAIYGLWRDPQGGTWCGGSCGEGQACCTITPLKPSTPG
ncbi:MAG TPA: hypothetical protein VFR81_06490 [Longimicrobium sp.]|nr:hypothetical protein [Longimicrobium sp.]